METGHLDPALVQGIIQAVYRLFRVGAFHSLDNDAIDLSIEQTLGALRRLDAFESEGITLIFAEDTCIVNGQLLQAPPDVYASAMDFSEFLGHVHVNSITIGKGVADVDLRELLGVFVSPETAASKLQDGGFLTRHIRLRLVNPNLLLGLEDDRLSLLERVLLTYALAVLVIRRLFESIEHGGFDLAGYFKRMARQLATVNYADRPVVLDVILARHLQPDKAKLAVNSAILAVAMTRRFTEHESTLSRICMSALLLDVGRHRSAALNDETADIAISTAIIHMAMGDLRGDSVERTIVTFEAQRLLAGAAATEIYPDGVEPTIDSHIVATARRFTELVSQQSEGAQLTADGAIEVLRRRASSDLGQMTLDLLVDALGLIPRGAAVELNSGYHAIVTRAGPAPSKYDQPTVRLVTDNRGVRTEPSVVKLSAENNADAERHRPVLRVLSRPSPLVQSAQRDVAGPFLEWVGKRKESEANVRGWLSDYQNFAEAPIEARRKAEKTSAYAVVGDARRAAVEWDAASNQQTGSTRVLERSDAATEYEYRESSSYEAVPDDFATGNRPESSIRARSSVRRTLGAGTHGGPGDNTGMPALATAPGSIHRRAATSGHAAVVLENEFVRSPSTRTGASGQFSERPSSAGGESPSFTRPATGGQRALDGASGAGTNEDFQRLDPHAFESGEPSGVLRTATGIRRKPTGSQRAVAPTGSQDTVDADAFSTATGSGVIRSATGRKRIPTGAQNTLGSAPDSASVNPDEFSAGSGSGVLRSASGRKRIPTTGSHGTLDSSPGSSERTGSDTFGSGSGSGIFRVPGGRKHESSGQAKTATESPPEWDAFGSASGSGGFRQPSGEKRVPTGFPNIVDSSSGASARVDADAFGSASQSGLFSRPDLSESRAASASGPKPRRDGDETPTAGSEAAASRRGTQVTPRTQRIVGADGGQAQIFRRSKTTGSMPSVEQREAASVSPRESNTGARRSIREHLAEAARRRDETSTATATADQRPTPSGGQPVASPAPFAGVLRRRKTTGSPVVVEESSPPPVTRESESGDNPALRGPRRTDTAETPVPPVETLRTLESVTGSSLKADEE